MEPPLIQAPLLFYREIRISVKYLVLKMFPYREHCPEIKLSLKVRKQQIISSRLLIIVLRLLIKRIWRTVSPKKHIHQHLYAIPSHFVSW
jgi:hypothetical protein